MTELFTGISTRCILLPNEPIASPDLSPPSMDRIGTVSERPPLSLWGLTLGMSLDLLSHMRLPHPGDIKKMLDSSHLYGNDGHDDSAPPVWPMWPLLFAPSMTSIFPTFSYPDVNFFIWVFGFRYRHLVKTWNERMQELSTSSSRRRRSSMPGTPGGGGSGSGSHDTRINFAGMALNQFYAAVRKALVVAIVLRASVLFGGSAAAIWWIVRRSKQGRTKQLYHELSRILAIGPT